MRRITSRQNPAVARFRDAARGDRDAPLLLDGVHLVTDALAAGLRIREAVVAIGAVDRPEISTLVGRLGRAGVEPQDATAPVMAAISPVRSSSTIVALAERPGVDASRLYAGPCPLVVVAVDVQDPGNVGAIIRVAEAGGATGVVTAGSSADPFSWKALRGSMGSTLRLPVIVSAAAVTLAEARARNCRIVASTPRGGRSLFDLDLAGPTVVLVGGEGAGLGDDLIGDADERVSIPMNTPVESLNAAVTAALIVYEARRQRR
jgi:TrmH family RNA methyltransferase